LGCRDRCLGQARVAAKTPTVIEVEHLTKNYGSRRAVDNISFSVASGDVVGFLGPNGAGKTTTMRMITGYLVPTSGSITVADVDLMTDSLEARRRVGYVPESVPLYREMTTRRYLEFMARLHGVNKSRVRARVDEVIEMCALEEYRDVVVGKLSKGYRQRVGLGQAIVHDPSVLILDEPTIGIDPIQVAQTKQLIKELGRDRTILISSHVLPEVSLLCERVIIIHEGKIVAEDTIENLSERITGAGQLKVKVGGPVEDVSDRIMRIAAVRKVTYRDPFHVVEFRADAKPHAEIAQAIVESGWALLATETVELSLEEIFLEFTTGGPHGASGAVGAAS
jgi:ABC-2 type transport system ATP-binding protein